MSENIFYSSFSTKFQPNLAKILEPFVHFCPLLSTFVHFLFCPKQDFGYGMDKSGQKWTKIISAPGHSRGVNMGSKMTAKVILVGL